MKRTSAGFSATGSGSTECPFCHVSLVRIRSKQPNTYDDWFLKCPYNIYVRILDIGGLNVYPAVGLNDVFWVQGDPTTCGYIHPEVPSVKLEAQEQRVKAKEASCACCYELKLEVQELKQSVDRVVAEFCKLKAKLAELKGSWADGRSKAWAKANSDRLFSFSGHWKCLDWCCGRLYVEVIPKPKAVPELLLS